jgi:hypothetical protein
VRLRAQIVIDIDAKDFAEAADHQLRVRRVFEAVQETYGQAQFEFRQRRERARRQLPGGRGVLHYTGRMNEYE